MGDGRPSGAARAAPRHNARRRLLPSPPSPTPTPPPTLVPPPRRRVPRGRRPSPTPLRGALRRARAAPPARAASALAPKMLRCALCLCGAQGGGDGSSSSGDDHGAATEGGDEHARDGWSVCAHAAFCPACVRAAGVVCARCGTLPLRIFRPAKRRHCRKDELEQGGMRSAASGGMESADAGIASASEHARRAGPQQRRRRTHAARWPPERVAAAVAQLRSAAAAARARAGAARSSLS